MAKLESFTMETIKRSQINLAGYNPRFISDDARARLKKGLKKFGLAQPLTVNRTTMTLVSGHQRLSIMDEEEKYPANDYEIVVAMVELSLEEEKALNVQMNNESMMGEFDVDALNEMVTDGVDINDLGFSESDIDILFSDNAALMELLEDTEEVKESKDILNDIKKDRQQMVDGQKESNSADYYFTVVCASQDEKIALLKKMGVPDYESFVPASKLALL